MWLLHFFAKRKGFGLSAVICSANMRTVGRPTITLFQHFLHDLLGVGVVIGFFREVKGDWSAGLQ